jgi:hypothetical protein
MSPDENEMQQQGRVPRAFWCSAFEQRNAFWLSGPSRLS